MKPWRKTINIKSIIHRDQANTSPDHISAVGKTVAGLVRARMSEAEWTMDLEDALERMEDLAVDDDPCKALNSALSKLYDWADRERVWLGL